MKQVYKGYIKLHEHGEHDALFLDGMDVPLAEQLRDDIDEYGGFLTVRYFLSDRERTLEELTGDLIRHIVGYRSADYTPQYSEYTGYLWTDEAIDINNHNLLDELIST